MIIPHKAGGINLAVGVSGSGKTHWVKNDVWRDTSSGMPVIVIDRMREWRSAPPGCKAAGARTVKDAIRNIEKGARLSVVETRSVEADAEAACAWARDYPGLAGVALPEAHRIAPNGHPLTPAVEDVATAWRHHKVKLWLDTQRLALLSKTLTEQAGTIKVFSIFGQRDLAVIKEWGGKQLEAAVAENARQLAEGNPGYCVTLGAVRVPPFKSERAQ